MRALSSPNRPVVVLGFNRGALGLARGLGRAGLPVIGVGFNPFVAIHSRYFSERILAAPQSYHGEPDLLQALEMLADRGRLVVFPATDGTVAWVADHWDTVREIADVPLPDDMNIMRRLRQKDLLGAEGDRVNLRSPRTRKPASAAEVRAAGLTPPIIVKPIQGKDFVFKFGAKLFVADTIDDAVAAWERASAGGIETIVQELIPDHEGNIYSFFGYLDREQRPLASVVGRKLRDAPREFGSSAVFSTEWNERVYELSVSLLQTAGYRGYAHVELAYDKRIDDFVLIEVNTRVPTWAGIAMSREFNIAKIAYLDLCGYEQESARLQSRRLWVDFVEDMRAGPPHLGEIAWFLRPYLARHSVGALFAPDDPIPALKEGVSVLRARVQLRTRLLRMARHMTQNRHGR